MRGVWNFLCDQISSGCLGHCHLFLPVFGNPLTTKSDPCTKGLRPLRWTLKESAAKQRSSQHSLDAKFCKSSWLNTKFLQSVCGNSCFNTIDCRLSLMHLNTSKWTSNMFKSIPCGRKPVFREYHIIYRLYIYMYVHIKLPGQVSMAFSSEFRRSPTSEILYHIVYLPLSKGGCGKCMNTDTAKSDATKKSENAAKDVYILPVLWWHHCSVESMLKEMIILTSWSHVAWLGIIFSSPETAFTPYRRSGKHPLGSPNAKVMPSWIRGPCLERYRYFFTLENIPRRKAVVEIWRKFPTKKKGEISTNLYLVPRKMQKNRWTLHVSLPGLIAVPRFSRIWKIIDLERFSEKHEETGSLKFPTLQHGRAMHQKVST